MRGADRVGDRFGRCVRWVTGTHPAGRRGTRAEIASDGDGDGFLENTATVSSNETPDDSDDAEVPVSPTPALNIVKTAAPGQVADVAGGPLTQPLLAHTHTAPPTPDPPQIATPHGTTS